MINVDFYRALSPIQFENFCRDLLEIREPGIKFTTFPPGRDGGIDIKSTNTGKEIIVQCKLYKPANYRVMFRKLKEEADKCKKQDPARYIFCTNIELTFKQASDIKELFGGYIKNEEDIINGCELNKYLNQAQYKDLLISYSTLLFPNLRSLIAAFEQTVPQKYYQQTVSFLHEIAAKHKLIHRTAQIFRLIQQLEKNNVIILTGNPGVGKTTTAMMLANYFLAKKKVEDLVFLQERDYADTLRVAKEKRVIVIDDFWGQSFSPAIKKHSTFQREFQTIIEHFTYSNNCFLILTSRDYVLKDVLDNAEYKTQDLLHTNKHVIQEEVHSSEDKIRILLNHLQFYDFDLGYFQHARYNDIFERIIMHQHYTPHHLALFIKNYLKRDQQSSYTFYNALYEYLENPQTFWQEAFQQLNPTARAILIVLLVSGDPMGLEDLEASFNTIQAKARAVLNEDVTPGDFKKELTKLEGLYISIKKDSYYDGTFIEFKSSGIKNYLLEFLRDEGNLWIYPIILNAQFFNQLIFVFSTKEEEIHDYDADIPLYGAKILLNSDQQIMLKQKLLEEFKTLGFCNHEEKELTDRLTKYQSSDETKYFKLILLDRLFPIKHPENEDVKKFVLNNVLKDIDTQRLENNKKVIAPRAMLYFPSVIKWLLPYLKIDGKSNKITPDTIIQIYYNSITFATEYSSFYSFKEIFPAVFERFYNDHIQEIKKHIKDLIYKNVEYYLEQNGGEIGIELDSLLMTGVEELTKQYNFTLTEQDISELESTFAMDFSMLRKKKLLKKTQLDASETEQQEIEDQLTSYARIVEEYLPDEVAYPPTHFLERNGYSELLEDLRNSKSALFSLKDGKEIFERICHFVVENKIVVSDLDTYQLIDKFFTYHCSQISVQPRAFIEMLYKIIDGLEQSNDDTVTRSSVLKILQKTELQNISIEDLSPILIPDKNWYRFSHADIQTYIITKYVNGLEADRSSELVTAYLGEYDDYRILQFLQSANSIKIWKSYLVPELQRLLNSINFANQQTVLLSFIDFFDVEFALAWEQKRLNAFLSSYSEAHYEYLLHFCGIEFYIGDLGIYFEDAITKLSKSTKMAKELYEHIPKKNINKDAVMNFEVSLLDFLKSDEYYTVVQQTGMASYVNGIVESIAQVISDKNTEG